MIQRRLGEQIHHLRIRSGLSQRALAEEAELSRIYIAKLEAGERISPSLPALERIAKALGAKVRIKLTS